MSGYTERVRVNDYVGPGIYAEVTWPLPCLNASGRHTFGRVSQGCVSCGTPATVVEESSRARAARPSEPGFFAASGSRPPAETEREALRREARQEAMLDAGAILAEYRQAKGE